MGEKECTKMHMQKRVCDKMGQKGNRQLVRTQEPGGFSVVATSLDGSSLREQHVVDKYIEKNTKHS